MSDTITLNAGSGGSVLATDDIGGVHYQLLKIGLGALDSFTLLDGNSGVKSAGTLRVVLATDQPALTNKLLTTPDLPSGASTAAKQPALGTAGSASADVITVQGVASMTALAVTEATLDALSRAEDAAHSSGHTGVMALAVRNATVTDLSAGNTDGDYEPLQVSAAGRLWASATIDAALPAGANVIGHVIADSGSTTAVTGNVAVTLAAGAAAIAKAEDVASADADVGVPAMMVRKATPANTSGTDGDYEMLQGSAGRLWVDASGVTLTVASHAVTNAGTFAVQEADGANTTLGAKADAKSTATDTTSITIMQVLKQISASVQAPPSQAVTNAGTFAAQAVLRPETSGGLTTAMFSGSDGSSILVATAQVVKASAGQLYSYYLYNPEAAVTFVHFYNTAAASVTVGTTNPLFTLAIPAGSAANLSIPQGIVFSNAGWSVAATTTAGGNTAPATGVSAVLFYA